ncbi:MAG TPA: hypothetical protein VII27_05410 [Thermoplasmata archaeon]
MRRENLVLLVGAILLDLGLLGLTLLFIFLGLPGPLVSISFTSWVIAAAIALGVLVLPKFRFSSSPASPERALAEFAHRLRASGYTVAEAPGMLDIRLGRILAVKVSALPSGEGSDLFFQMSATSDGWFVSIMSIIWFAPVALNGFLYAFARVRSSVRERIAPILSGGAPLPEDEIRTGLVAGLAEAHRLALEGYEAERSAYWDTAGLVLIGAILIFGVVLAGSLVASSGAVLRVRVIDGLAQSATASTTFGVVAWFVVRQRLRPRLFEIRRWMGRLRDAWTREASGGTPADAGPSVFELLMEASREVPGWLEARRRTSLSRDWGGFTVLWLLAGGSVGLFIQAGAGAVLGNPLLAVIGASGGLGLAAGSLWFYRWWNRLEREAIERTRASWERRFQAVRERMEQHLQDL